MESATPAVSGVRDAVGERPLVNRVPMVTEETLAVARAFQAQPGDVFISTYPKTGTTWLQQICHQLRTGGHTDFDEISDEGVVPWLTMAPCMHWDIALPQVAWPRCFKTHQALSALSYLEEGGAKFLGVFRDPEAALLSYFKFSVQWEDPCATAKDVNVFIQSLFATPGGEGDCPPDFEPYIWGFYADFWKCRNLPNVKILVFEHMKRDLAAQLGPLAEFMGLPPLSEEKRATVAELCSMAWMSEHHTKFDDHAMGAFLAELEPAKQGIDQGVKKVGLDLQASDVNAAISEETRALLARMWRMYMLPVTGHKSYAEMIEAL